MSLEQDRGFGDLRALGSATTSEAGRWNHEGLRRILLERLRRIGCLKFIAREVPIEQVRCLYGRLYDVIEEAIDRGCPLRVLDYNGRRIFRWLPFSDFGPAYQKEMPVVAETTTRPSTDAIGTAAPAAPKPATCSLR
jgi:hypothetical protein